MIETHPDSAGVKSAHVSDTWGNSLLTKEQAADYLQVTTRYLERAVAAGRLRAYRPSGGVWRVRVRDLDAYLESGATIGGEV